MKAALLRQLKSPPTLEDIEEPAIDDNGVFDPSGVSR